MASLWPWLVIAALGALHGLNPATGWLLAAAWGVHTRERSQALRALVPIALGHTASVALVATGVVLGLSMDRTLLGLCAGALCAVFVATHLWQRTPPRARQPAGQAGLALWSFAASSVQGAGLMLVPALLPLCVGDAAAGALSTADAWGPALGAVLLHSAAMLAVTGLVASGACRGWEAGARWLCAVRHR